MQRQWVECCLVWTIPHGILLLSHDHQEETRNLNVPDGAPETDIETLRLKMQYLQALLLSWWRSRKSLLSLQGRQEQWVWTRALLGSKLCSKAKCEKKNDGICFQFVTCCNRTCSLLVSAAGCWGGGHWRDSSWHCPWCRGSGFECCLVWTIPHGIVLMSHDHQEETRNLNVPDGAPETDIETLRLKMQYLQALLLSSWRSRKSLLSLQGRQEQWVWTRALLGSKLCSKAKCEKKNDGICFQFVTCCNRTCSLLVSAAGCWGGGHWRDSSWHCPWCRGSGFECCLVWTIPHGILLMSHDHQEETRNLNVPDGAPETDIETLRLKMQYLQALLLSWWRSRKSLLSLQGRQEQWVWTRALLGSKLCSKAKCEKKNDGICFQFVTCCSRTCWLLVSAAGCWGGGHWRDSSWHCPWCRGSGFACCLVWTIPHGILLLSHDHQEETRNLNVPDGAPETDIETLRLKMQYLQALLLSWWRSRKSLLSLQGRQEQWVWTRALLGSKLCSKAKCEKKNDGICFQFVTCCNRTCSLLVSAAGCWGGGHWRDSSWHCPWCRGSGFECCLVWTIPHGILLLSHDHQEETRNLNVPDGAPETDIETLRLKMQYLQALLLFWWRSRKSLLSLQGRKEQWVWTRALLGSKLCSKAKCEKKNDGICFQFVTCCNRTCSLLVSAAGCWGGGHWRDSSWHCPWCRGSGFECCLVWTIPHGILLLSHDHQEEARNLNVPGGAPETDIENIEIENAISSSFAPFLVEESEVSPESAGVAGAVGLNKGFAWIKVV